MNNINTILVPGPTFYLRGSSNLYMIPLEKALPIMRSRGFDRPFPPLPLCERCLSDCATKVNGLFGNVCDACYDKEMGEVWKRENTKTVRKKERILRNNRICSTCSIRKACIKNGRKYKTCEECLIKKRDERLKRISEEKKKQENNENNIYIPPNPL